MFPEEAVRELNLWVIGLQLYKWYKKAHYGALQRHLLMSLHSLLQLHIQRIHILHSIEYLKKYRLSVWNYFYFSRPAVAYKNSNFFLKFVLAVNIYLESILWDFSTSRPDVTQDTGKTLKGVRNNEK